MIHHPGGAGGAGCLSDGKEVKETPLKKQAGPPSETETGQAPYFHKQMSTLPSTSLLPGAKSSPLIETTEHLQSPLPASSTFNAWITNSC